MGPRLVGALALVVLASAGITDLLIQRRPTSLVGRPTWALAQTLPTQDDFPAAWNYAVHGTVGFATPQPAPQPGPATLIPTADYLPVECAQLPAALIPTLPGTPTVHVDRTPVGVASAAFYFADSVAGGQSDADEPNADFAVSAPADPAGFVTQYLDWLGSCGTYRVTLHDPRSHRQISRSAATSVEAPADGAALTVTRTFLDDGAERPREYRVSFYPVRGLLLTCKTSMTGADAQLIDTLAAATARKLAAL